MFEYVYFSLILFNCIIEINNCIIFKYQLIKWITFKCQAICLFWNLFILPIFKQTVLTISEWEIGAVKLSLAWLALCYLIHGGALEERKLAEWVRGFSAVVIGHEMHISWNHNQEPSTHVLIKIQRLNIVCNILSFF